MRPIFEERVLTRVAIKSSSLLAFLVVVVTSPCIHGFTENDSEAVLSEHSTRTPTNIVLIMIDDLGWSDLACQGNRLVETPNIDRFAEQGMRFTNAYAAAPVCSPTRAAIMTGQAPARLKITNHIPDRDSFLPEQPTVLPAAMTDRLDLEYQTIAEVLKDCGYATGFFGKWHLAGRGDPRFYPEHQGFDINIGGCDFGGPPTFFDPYRIPTIENRQEGEYLPDRLADEVVDFVREHQAEPFFVCLWNYTVHWPMEAPEPLLEKYKDRVGRGLNDTRYGAMIEAMDTSIGRILAELDELELSDDTLVIFTSDNGGFDGVSDNRPLRESKGYLYEGGIRVPMIARWPGVIDEGVICDTPTISMDLFPTLADVGGARLNHSELDGESLKPLLEENASLERDAIYFHYPNYAWHRSNRLGSAIRKGDYKLIYYYDDESVELYNLAEDLSESTNLADSEPQRCQQLREELMAWLEECEAEFPTRAEPEQH